MATKLIPGRISTVGISADGQISVKMFDEDAALYHSNAIGDAVARQSYPNNSVSVAGSTILRLLDIATLRDADDGPGFYAAMRGVTSAWSAAVLYESDDDTADYHEIKTIDVAAPIGFLKTVLANGRQDLWDYVNTFEVELSGGGLLESVSEDETLKGERAYLVGSEILLNQNWTQLSATRWRADGPLLRGYKGTEWAMTGHALNERFVFLSNDTIRRINDELADLDIQRRFKAVTAGQSIDNAAVTLFTNTGISLKCYSPVDIAASFDGSDNINGTFKRRSRLMGRNGRDFFDPPLGEAIESYEIDILSDDELTVKRTLTSTNETFFYAIADETTDFGARKEFNLHVCVYQISADVGRGYPGCAILNPSGFSEVDGLPPPGPTLAMLFENGAIMEFEDGETMYFEG